MDILVASLQVVIHSHRPLRFNIILCNDRVGEAELAIVLILLLELIEVERPVVGLPFPGNLLTLLKRTRLNFKANDALME